jgi:arylsulfatase A-like enzyme
MRRWLGVLVCLLCASSARANEKPLNVIIILADDLGWGDVGCYGHKFKTPHLDLMAKNGARLTSFYTPVPFCAPTRGSLLTGRYPPRHGLTGNPVPKDDPLVKNLDDLGLPLSEVVLAQLFRAAGYRTGMIGKWHLGHQPHFRPTQRGFDEYLGILYSNDMHKVELFDGDKVVEYPVVQSTLTQRYTERAIEFLVRNRGRPFFLYFAHAMPHKPIACSESFYKKSGAGLYADVMAELDWSVGQILAKLKELGLDDNTLVIFTSDNGPWYGGSTGGLRGMKGHHWEGGLRVPCIAHWPGRIPAGHENHEPAGTIDIFPTVLDAAKIAPPKDRKLDGKSILPMLTGKAKSPHEAIFSFRGGQVSSVRSGPWKLHLLPPSPAKFKVWQPADKYVDPRGPDGVTLLAPYEQAHPSQFPGVLTGDPVTSMGLFNLIDDRAEQRNLLDNHPEVVARLRKLADDMQANLPAVQPKKKKKL